ncbi:MAG: hypothetical protein AAGF09_06155 [Pseudomonadota bacterium]
MRGGTLTEADLSKMLGVALVEIRASDTLERARLWADVFHNVPAGLQHGVDPEEIYTRMLDCAKRWGDTQWLERQRDWAIRHR